MEFSSLSDQDFVRLVASYTNQSTKEKHNVSSKLNVRGYTPEQLARVKVEKTNKFNSVESCGLRFTRPFDHLKFEPLGYVLTLYENYERGCLPFEGCVSEQPAQIMEVFSIIKQLKYEAEKRVTEEYSSRGRNQHKNKPRTRR